ncbi:hypothetical protein A7A55_08325 [Acinetobacter baumannii]|nr:hypothetical protein A7A55_08325 [Acinetobacter baumannii]
MTNLERFGTTLRSKPAKYPESCDLYAQELVSALSPEIFAQLQQHQLLGDQVVLVSASIDIYLAPLCKELSN